MSRHLPNPRAMAGRGRLATAAVAATTLLGIAACGQQAAARLASGGSTLTVRTTLMPSRGMYVEGAVAEVTLVAPDGDEVATTQGDIGRPILFRHLASGRYTLKPALRPCDGTCSHLDPRANSCAGQIDVTGQGSVEVAFIVSGPCRIGAVSGG